MISDAGHGAAMASAPPEVRLAARYIAAPVEEDGSAALIEQLILADADEAAANAERLGPRRPRSRSGSDGALARRLKRRRGCQLSAVALLADPLTR